jgi:hypothetical protein
MGGAHDGQSSGREALGRGRRSSGRVKLVMVNAREGQAATTGGARERRQ